MGSSVPHIHVHRHHHYQLRHRHRHPLLTRHAGTCHHCRGQYHRYSQCHCSRCWLRKLKMKLKFHRYQVATHPLDCDVWFCERSACALTSAAVEEVAVAAVVAVYESEMEYTRCASTHYLQSDRACCRRCRRCTNFHKVT